MISEFIGADIADSTRAFVAGSKKAKTRLALTGGGFDTANNSGQLGGYFWITMQEIVNKAAGLAGADTREFGK